ncbi:MAG: hypothetical protein NT049_19065 [Planctomycetota bacterium]|nr:hypothetical protein [Planctomycetota bacterium]
MKRLALVAVLMLLVVGGRAMAQQGPGLEGLRSKTALADGDRAQLRQWLAATVNTIITNADPDRRGMISARDTILSEARSTGGQSPAFRQVFAEELVAVVKEAEKRAVSPESRVNLFMAVAELKAPEAVTLLVTALEKDPYPASRYWAARGLDMTADTIAEKGNPRLEQEMSAAAAKAFDGDISSVDAYLLLDMLGKFDLEAAHDALVDCVIKFVAKASASDPIAVQAYIGAVASLKKAYAKEVRPDGKARMLTGFAYLCAWILPPAADPGLMAGLNGSLEEITGEKVGYPTTADPVNEKLALMEWVEKLVRDKKIPKRPTLPTAVEDAVKELKGALGGAAK